MRKLQLTTLVACALLAWPAGRAATAGQMAIILNPAAASPATATSVPGFPGVAGTTNIWTDAPSPWVARADGPYSIGQEFTTGSSSLTVTALGTMAYTNNGGSSTGLTNMLTANPGTPTTYLNGQVQVGLFKVGNTTPIATAEVGSTGLQNGYFFQSITPVVLAPNTAYIMEAYVGNGIEWFLDGSDISQSNWNGTYVPVAANNNLVTVTSGVFSAAVGGLSYPTNIFDPSNPFSQNDPFRWGPANFLVSVPEPAPLFAILSMLGTLVVYQGTRQLHRLT